MTRMENGQTVSEGLCLPCAKELGLKPVDDLMNKMGLSEEDLDKMSDQMMEVMGDMEDGEDGFEKGMGLFSMRERIEKLNGIINISSEKGFKIFISVPKNKKGFSITE